jgi:hypothetical protein
MRFSHFLQFCKANDSIFQPPLSKLEKKLALKNQKIQFLIFSVQCLLLSTKALWIILKITCGRVFLLMTALDGLCS